MPAEGKQPLRFDAVDGELELETLVGLLGFGDLRVDGSRHNLSNRRRARDKGAVELDAEPAAELLGVANRAPHALARRVQQNFLLDAIGVGTHNATSRLHLE